MEPRWRLGAPELELVLLGFAVPIGVAGSWLLCLASLGQKVQPCLHLGSRDDANLCVHRTFLTLGFTQSSVIMIRYNI